MGVEAFLRFWSHYNTLIIEILIGLILLTVVYLAFRTFFGPEEETAGGVGNELKSGDLEKTLQKILERQESAPAAPPVSQSSPAALSFESGEAPASTNSSEVAELRTQLAERERQIAEIKQAAAAAPAASALAGDEKKGYEDRLKDLEARLAEYEIISEDIADLSFYKEENSKLQKEISSLKEKTAEAPAAAQPLPDPIAELGLEPEPAPASPEPESAPAAEAAPPSAPAEPTAATEAAPLPKEEEAELMNQFENFVKKG